MRVAHTLITSTKKALRVVNILLYSLARLSQRRGLIWARMANAEAYTRLLTLQTPPLVCMVANLLRL